MKFKAFVIFFNLFLFIQPMFAQERSKDSLQDQVVNVVKPYSPTVSDAFKIREVPQLNDSNTTRKKNVKYNIFSIPVASTFTPAKGKAAAIEKQKRPKLFDNYASLGLGTFQTFLAELYLSHDLSNNQSIGAYIGHHTSLGDIEGVLLDNDFSNTEVTLDFTQKERDFSWKIDAGYELSMYNWYGLPDMIYSIEDIAAIDPGHTFNAAMIGGALDFDDMVFKSVDIGFRRFSDSYNSGENLFDVHFKFDLPIQDNELQNSIDFTYLGGNFDRSFNVDQALNYSFINLGLGSSYVLQEEDLTVNLGVKLVYLGDLENSDNNFYIYPNIEASYRLVSDVVIGYGGVTGDLIQNSYYDFADRNPFVSPTLFIAPTDQRYNVFLGVKGKLSSQVGYNIKGGYTSEDNKALFLLNPAVTVAEENYQFGNSFGVIYDDVSTISIEGELNVDFSRNFTLGIKGAYFNYNTKEQAEAWNLPDFTASLFLDYQITEQWFAGASAFFVGQRKDLLQISGSFIEIPDETIVLDSFLDINAHLGYRINSQFSMFAKVNNIANQGYEQWANFPVQTIQFIAGATYQFDF
jgi:hypothetical protein